MGTKETSSGVGREGVDVGRGSSAARDCWAREVAVDCSAREASWAVKREVS